MTSTVLKPGATGADVIELQRALAAHNFKPGDLDGLYGPATVAAVVAFQNSNGLLADGIAGPRTLFALGLATDDTLPDSTGSVSVQMVSQMFPATPVRNIKANLPPVLEALVRHTLQDKTMVLVALGTIRAETEGFVPISEGVSSFNTSPNQHPFVCMTTGRTWETRALRMARLSAAEGLSSLPGGRTIRSTGRG